MIGVAWITAIFLPRYIPFIGEVGYLPLVEWMVGMIEDPETGKLDGEPPVQSQIVFLLRSSHLLKYRRICRKVKSSDKNLAYSTGKVVFYNFGHLVK